jgi:2-alkyl-3-oxoalkanoate reductase
MAYVAVVTGATGFLGRAFAAELHRRGWEVRGVDVRPGPRVTVGDVSRRGAWVEVLAGADLVIHTAAIVAESGDRHAFWRVNVDGTRTVLEEAGRAGVARVLHLSSVVVLGPAFPDGADETTPVRMTGNPYTDTKVAAEHQALLFAAAGSVPVTIVRFGDAYGPHAQPWTVRPIELLRRGLLVLPDGGHGILSPTYVDDAVAGGLAAATSEAAIGEVFHITGGEGVEVQAFLGYYAAMLGRGMRSLPAAALTAVAGPIEVVARSFGRAPPLSPRALEYVRRTGTYSIAKAQQMLDWSPQVPLEEGMERTRLWLEEVGLVGSDG